MHTPLLFPVSLSTKKNAKYPCHRSSVAMCQQTPQNHYLGGIRVATVWLLAGFGFGWGKQIKASIFSLREPSESIPFITVPGLHPNNTLSCLYRANWLCSRIYSGAVLKTHNTITTVSLWVTSNGMHYSFDPVACPSRCEIPGYAEESFIRYFTSLNY